MRESTSQRPLPNTVKQLQAVLSAQYVLVDTLQEKCDQLTASRSTDKEEIARLTLLIDKFKRMLFGRKSEKLTHHIEQLELALEALQSTQPAPSPASQPTLGVVSSAPKRRPLPEHLPRDVHVHRPTESACPKCGGEWITLGEDISEVLEYVPASYRVIRHVRPRLRCGCCAHLTQANAPTRPIPKSYYGPGLISHLIIGKYMDHQPIYRQCRQAAREGVELSESTIGDVIGATHQLLRPLMAALRRYVFAAEKLHADDTPIAVLAPGTGKTRQARLWVYARDDRPAASQSAPAVWFAYSPNRQGIHPQTHLKAYAGILQADAYAGYNAVYESGKVIEAGCWAHARRKFYEIHQSQPTLMTAHVLEQVALLYQIEADIRGSPPEVRQAVRQERARLIVTGLQAWLKEQLPTLSRKSVIAEAVGYMMNQWQALVRYLDDGRIEIDNNAAERALRAIALGRKNYLFLGSDAGGERAATMYSLLGTVKLNGMNPETYLRHVLSVIADYPVNCIDELLPWNLTLNQALLPQAA